MPQWVIKSISNQVICTVKSVEKHGQLMNGRWLTVDIDSAVKLALSAGCYIEFEGIRYSIRSFADVEKSARQLSHGGAFSYKGLRLDDVSWQALEDTQMCDYVYGDNHLHYSGLGTFSFFASKASDVGYRVLANLRNKYGSSWNVLINGEDITDNYEDYTFDEAKSISISAGTSVKEALDLLWSNWGVYYKVGIRTVDIITSDREPGIELKYGKDEGLKSIRRKINPNVEICTRVRAYGSERNMPYRWYNNKYGNPSDPHDPLRSMYIPQLMLPQTAYTVNGEFINSRGELYKQGDTGAEETTIWDRNNIHDVVLPSVSSIIQKYGSRDKEIHWNSDDMGEIFPSMKGMTATDVGVDSDTWADDRLDLLLSTAINEDGTAITGTGNTSELTTGKINFKVRVPNPGFDPMAQKGQEDVVLLMQSGKCQSRGFVILKSEAVIDNEQIVAYDLTCVKTVDDEIDQVFPNGNYTINGGEEYVYTGLTFNDESSLESSWLAVYIGAAEKRLLRAAALWLREHQTEQYVYEITPDNIYLQRQKDENENFDITEGDFITLSQDDLGHSEEVVETVVVRYGKEAIPTYEISFLRRDESESLGDRVKGLVGQTISVDSDIAKMNDAMYKKVNKSGFHTLFDPLDAQYNVLDINGDLTNLKYIRANVDFFSIKGVAALGTVSGGGGGGGGADLNALLDSINDSDIGNTMPTAAGQVITWNGSKWVFNIPSGGGGGTDLLSVWKSLTNDSSLSSYSNNTKIAEAHIPSLPYVQRTRGVEMYTSDSINYVSARLLNASGSYDDVRQRKASYGNGTHNGYIEWYAGDSYGYMNHAMGHLILTDGSNQIWADTSGNKKFSLPSASGTLATQEWVSVNDANNYLTGVSGSANGTMTFTRQGLTSITFNSSHTHSNYVSAVNFNNSATLTSPYYVVTTGSVSGNTLTLGRRTLASILNASGYSWWGQTMDPNGVVKGDIFADNNFAIRVKASSGASYNNILNLTNDSPSILDVGWGSATQALCTTRIWGNATHFMNSVGTETVSLSNNGQLYVTQGTQGVRIGNALLSWEQSSNSLKVTLWDGTPCNFYSLGGIAALGATSGSGGLTELTLGKLNVTGEGVLFDDGDGVSKIYSSGGMLTFECEEDFVFGSSIDMSNCDISNASSINASSISAGSAKIQSSYVYLNTWSRLFATTVEGTRTVYLQIKNSSTNNWDIKGTWN